MGTVDAGKSGRVLLLHALDVLREVPTAEPEQQREGAQRGQLPTRLDHPIHEGVREAETDDDMISPPKTDSIA